MMDAMEDSGFDSDPKVIQNEMRGLSTQHMTSEEDANIAIAGLNGHEFQQCALNVELSDNQSGRRGGGGGGGRGRDDRRGGRGRDRGGRGRGGDRGRRGGGRDYGRDRYEPYGRSERYNDYDPYGRDDPYGDYPPPRRPLRDPYDDPYYRDPYSRDPYADPYLRDPYSRDPYARDPYSRDPYSSRDPYARPPPDYYSRLRDPSDPYGYDRGGPGGGRDEELVSYPPPRATNATNGYSKGNDVSFNKSNDASAKRAPPGSLANPQLYTSF